MPVSTRDRLLILGGTGEALALARQLAEDAPDLTVTTSLAGRTQDPILPPGEVRIGGFGGVDGLVAYCHANQISVVVNATHPFAAEMGLHALEAHRRAGIPLLRLLRPAWRRQPRDSWIKAPHAKAAAGICRWLGKRVFLALGARDLPLFAGIERAHFLVRLVDMPAEPLPLASYDVIAARGPFSLAAERLLMLEHGIDLVVAKNSGGDGAFAKIEVARELGVPVVMIERPEIALHPGCETADTVETALDWIAQRVGHQIVFSRRTGESSATTGDSA